MLRRVVFDGELAATRTHFDHALAALRTHLDHQLDLFRDSIRDTRWMIGINTALIPSTLAAVPAG